MQNVYGAMADVYRKTNVGRIQEDWCGMYTGMDKLVHINAAGEANEPRDN